ncbi:NB-ARC domain-containing protein [Actinacidiphila yanglinensis]|uniref:NB-ARC domain-containing protein n=1 Tax=Actinacidiphila yanglinensis TaxID=310779 RepID=UPI0011B0AA1A|nr:NB-ARC domain-containing protein [Actinacidiphila yanglinensis]
MAAAVLVAIGAVAEAVASLAENAATGQARWPGPLDLIREHAWWVLGIGLMLALVLGVLAVVRDQRGEAAGGGDPPPPAPPQRPRWVVDRAQAREVADELCRCDSSRSVGITTTAGLHGAGGFGKTTLAETVWADPLVQRRFRGRIYRVTLGLEVRGRAAVAAKVAEATRFITGDTTIFDDPELAGEHLGRLLDVRPDLLLILDDVWTVEQLQPFLAGGARCRRLITTRLPELLPPDARSVLISEMSGAQAQQVLTFGLPGQLPRTTLDGLLRSTGRWPLLLRLANRLVHRRIATGADLAAAGTTVLEQLRRQGPTGLDPEHSVDLNDPRARQTAVRAAVEAGAAPLLPPGGFDRFTELGVFAEDESFPVPLIVALWRATAGLGEERARDLCATLAGLSLITLDPAGGGRVQLHDVFRDFLRSRLGRDRLRAAHEALVNAAALDVPEAEPQPGGRTGPNRAWWRMPDGYLADHLVSHLLAAGRTTDAEVLATDLRWIAWRLDQRAAATPVADLTLVPTPTARQAARELARTTHLLAPTNPPHARAAILRSRLADYGTWRVQSANWRDSNAALYNRWPLPDLPDPAQRLLLPVHVGEVSAMAVSPNGRWFTIGCLNGSVQVWDVAIGCMLRNLTSHAGPVRAVAFSFDSTWLATAGDDRCVRVSDAATGLIQHTLSDFTDPVRAVAVSPDAMWLATDGTDGSVQDAVSGRILRTLAGPVNTVAVSPDSTWLVTGGFDGIVQVWDAATGRIRRTLTGHTGLVHSVVVSPDGTWLATVDDEGIVRIWDAATGHVRHTLTDPTDQMCSVAISPDGTWLATSGILGAVRLWDVATGRIRRTVTNQTGPVYSVVVSPDGTWLATGGVFGAVRVWDAVTNRTSPERTDRIRSVHALATSSPDGGRLATAGEDGAVQIRDADTGRILRTLNGRTGPVGGVAVSPDGAWLVTSGDDGIVRVWDAATGHVRHAFAARVGGVAVSPDGAWLVTSGDDGIVRVWDAATGHVRHAFAARVRGLAVSPDGAWLVTSGDDGIVRVWDAATGRNLRTLNERTSPVGGVAVSPDSTWLVTGSFDGIVRVWDAATGRIRHTLTGHAGPVDAVAISPNGRWLVTVGAADWTVRVWELGSGTPLALMRTEASPRSCCFLPDGRGLAVGGGRGLYGYTFDPG